MEILSSERNKYDNDMILKSISFFSLRKNFRCHMKLCKRCVKLGEAGFKLKFNLNVDMVLEGIL